MRIDCPNCAAAYEVPEAVLTARRVMRCARCGTEFTPAAPVMPAPVPAASARTAWEEPPAATPSEASASPDRRMGLSVVPQDGPAAPRRALVLGAWLLSFVLLAAAAWAAIAWRGPVMRAWPASARLYAALGYMR